MKKKIFLVVTMFLFALIAAVSFAVPKNNMNGQKKELTEEQMVSIIKDRYNKYVIGKTDINLYTKEDDKYTVKGKIPKNTYLILEDMPNITSKDTYFKLMDTSYYVYYEDVIITKVQEENNNKDNNYIVFNENIITNKIFKLYDKMNNVIFEISDELSLPIIIKDTNKYGVIYNKRLLYVLKEDVNKVVESHNTDEETTSGIAALNYHFFYDEEANETCNEIICHSTSQFESHLKYLKDNNYYAVSMNDLEMFIDGKIRLPKNSVLITIDDGVKSVATRALPLLEKYQMKATLFLITSWFSKDGLDSPYLELHSHGHDLHNKGICPGGQGGAIKCLDKQLLLNDLKTSREILYNTTVFCYPFYEYNNYAIEVLKEAGITMAFASGKYKITSGSNKYVLPRYVIYKQTTLNDFIKMIR